MRVLALFLSLAISCPAICQQSQYPNIFIITTDGLRNQEIFEGADSSLLTSTRFTNDTSLSKLLFWASDLEERKKKLMPFFWNVMVPNGVLLGNRNFGSEVNMENPYRISYAGYNEIFTGFADQSIMSNARKANSNENVLSFLNQSIHYRNKVAVFTSWGLFNDILVDKKNSLKLNAGPEASVSDSTSVVAKMVTALQKNSVCDPENLRDDRLTFSVAEQFIKKNLPKVVYIGFGETDEYAHRAQYGNYLNAAGNVDHYLKQLWQIIRAEPFYNGNTYVLVTTDHSRGRGAKWTKHGWLTEGSEHIWLYLFGPDILAEGESKKNMQIFGSQIASTIAELLKHYFTSNHPVAEPITGIYTASEPGTMK